MAAASSRLPSAAAAKLRAFSKSGADVVVVGAGIAGVACAHYLSRLHNAKVLLVERAAPLAYTSALSTECYRNFWAGSAPMTEFMNHSIDLLEERARECNNAFGMNRRGYWFLSATEQGAQSQLHTASEAAKVLPGAVRVYTDGDHGQRYTPDVLFDAPTDAVSLFHGREAVAAFTSDWPGIISPQVQSLMHCGRSGWMSAQQMGAHLLEQAREAGTMTLCPGELVRVHAEGGRVHAVSLTTDGAEAETVACQVVVNCAGPFAAELDLLFQAASGGGGGARRLPLLNEVHAKGVLRDVRGVVPSTAPMMIWQDAVDLGWSENERDELRAMGGFEARLASSLPAGAHFRPYAGTPTSLIMLWEAVHADVAVPCPPPESPTLRNELYGELLLRALSKMVPRLREYFEEDGTMTASVSVDGGYYTKTPDNMPLIGPACGAPSGAFVCAGLSGYGVMAANAAGHLLAQHVCGAPLPRYAADFHPARWEQTDYLLSVQGGGVSKGLQI